MKKLSVFLFPLAIAAGAVALAPSAMARDRVDWSISIGSPGYYGPPPPVVYSPPPVVYAPPPPVVYVPRTAYPMVGPGVVYTTPPYMYGYREGEWRHRRWHHHHDRD